MSTLGISPSLKLNDSFAFKHAMFGTVNISIVSHLLYWMTEVMILDIYEPR